MSEGASTGGALPSAQRAGFLVGRVLLGLYFIIPGLTKIAGFADTSAYMAVHGVPLVPVLLVVTIVLQVGGGACLAIGYRTPVMAFMLAGLTLVISLFMHDFWNSYETTDAAHETQNFIKNLAIMAGLLVLGGTAKGGSKG
jgi:putative oxidoreductase